MATTTKYILNENMEFIEDKQPKDAPKYVTMKSFLLEYPELAAVLYISPFVLTLVAWKVFKFPRATAIVSAVFTALLLAAGLKADWPAGVNFGVAGTPVLVFGAYTLKTKMSS